MYINESGSNKRTENQLFGYAYSGVIARVQRWLRSKKRVSVCPVYLLERVIDLITYYRSIDTEIFKDFIINKLLSVINTFLQLYSVLIIDNAEFYYIHRISIKEACQAKGVLLYFLLLYSPDFNLIEEFFGDLKKFIRKTYKKEHSHFNTYQDYLE